MKVTRIIMTLHLSLQCTHCLSLNVAFLSQNVHFVKILKPLGLSTPD